MGNLEFPRFPQKSFITSTTEKDEIDEFWLTSNSGANLIKTLPS